MVGHSKTIGKITIQLWRSYIYIVSSYLNSHNLNNACQSAYRPGYSTETALLKVVNDLFLFLNKGNISVLALLDFSSAFEKFIILPLYTVSILTLDLLILSFNGFHLI